MNKTIIKDRVHNFKEEVSRYLFKKILSFSPRHITFLLEEELEFVEKNDRIEGVIILYDFINWLKKKR